MQLNLGALSDPNQKIESILETLAGLIHLARHSDPGSQRQFYYLDTAANLIKLHTERAVLSERKVKRER